MKSNASFTGRSGMSGAIVGILVACTLLATAHAAPTPLATEPITAANKIKALPNIMFVLDDSGSMSSNYLPDWAGPYQALVNGVLTVITPAHRFFNNAYNGVAYDPGVRYDPPVMFGATGTPDTTTYPSQTGQSAATGGDATATAALPNWRAVKVDGYGVQSALQINLEGKAYSYTTVAGEYCDSTNLRNCIASSAPTGANPFPAKLRWCTTSPISVDTTANAGTACQASNIADTPTNQTNGVTIYTFPRMPSPHTATVTVGNATTVTSILVGAQQILSADAAGGTSTDVASAIVLQINACTYGIPTLVLATRCTAVGYRAVSLANAVTITSPVGLPAAALVVTGGAAAAGAFSNGNVPGSSLLTVVTPTINSYAYPGTAAKGAKRFDCAGATCTYAEEMVNYANWYAYYRTRMQMMKTDASIAFATVDDKFRVGYYSINNGANTQFLNPSAFDGVQKNLWYSKFLSAVPFGATPLRNALANIGRMYAGNPTALNGQVVTDPIQYSCQQNYTILSTDGYWNDATVPTKIDGVTEIGEQDSNLDRPYYDGGTFTRTVSQTTKSESQRLMSSLLVQSRTQQEQKSSSQLDQKVVTTDTYPWTTTTSTLQTQTTPLDKVDYALVQSTYPLTSTTKQLQQSIYKLNSTPRILQSYIKDLKRTTTPLDAKTYKVTAGTQLLTESIYKDTVGTQLLTQSSYKDTVGTQLLTESIYKDTVGTQLLTQKNYNLTTTTYALQSSTYKLKSSTRQLQQRNEYSLNGGDSWPDTGWFDVSSCTTATNGPGWVRNTRCRYHLAVDAGGLDTCTTIAPDPLSPYTVEKGVTCAYEAVPTVVAAATCDVVARSASSPYTPSVSCGYSPLFAQATGQATCTAKDQTAALSMSGDKVVCAYDALPATTTENLASCTWTVPSPAASAPKTDCSYQIASNATGQNSCTAAALGTVTTNGQVWNTGVTCTYDAVPTTTTNLASCTWTVPATAASAPKTECSYQIASNVSGQNTCTAAALGTVTTNGTAWNTGVACSYDAVPTTLANQPTCTWVVPATAASLPKTDCVYNDLAATSVTAATCTPAARSTGSTDGIVWSGPAVACDYNSAVLQDTNLADCTNGTASTGPIFGAYITCGYINGTTLTDQNSCTYIPDSSGPVYSGPANACAYSATASVTNEASCTKVDKDLVNFSAPQKTCAYEAVGTPATSLASCTTVPQSSGAGQWSGPNVTCAYSGTATVTNPATCTVNVEGGSPYVNGAQVSCAYANGITTANVQACTEKAKQTLTTTGTAYAPAAHCSYGTPTGYATALAACAPVAQSAGPAYAGPARDCRYTAWSAETYAVNCTVADQAGYSNLTARTCVLAPFDRLVSTVTTTEDSCSTDPTTGVSPVDPAVGRATATSCTYRAFSAAVDTAACTPRAKDAVSPYATAVTCSSSDTGFVAAASCTPAGTLPAAFDATGKIVECSTTDTTPYSAAYPSATNTKVPVPACTQGTDPITQVQTTCYPLITSGPTPVDPATCPSSVAAAAPDYVTTTCTPTTENTQLTGCSAPALSAPFWQTVTCTDNGDGTKNTLADVASYYYWTDLRTSTLGNCTGSIVPPAVAGNTLCSAADDVLPLAAGPGVPVSAYNNVPFTAADPNRRQHMTTFTLGLGASGYMNFSAKYLSDIGGDYATVYGVAPHAASNGIAANPASGVCSWQSLGNCNWPFPASDEQTTIDDLWHAGVNGHGAYFSATNPDSLAASISQALNTVAAAGGATAAPGISNPSLVPGDNYLFGTSYTSLDWTGELIRRQLDPYTGAVAATNDWAAQAKLDHKAAATRKIYFFDGTVAGTRLKDFTFANLPAAYSPYFRTPHISTPITGLTQYLCASPLICLAAADQLAASGENLVNFLRGDRTYENTPAAPPPAKYYRLRQHVLGDIVNAQAVYVNKPFYSYADLGYASYVSAVAARPAVVYAGANDGMLHAFAAAGTAATEAAVAASAAATSAARLDPSLAGAAVAAAATAAAAVAGDLTIGQELWAYIPSMVMPNLYLLADMDYKSKHRYYVDATPAVGDICTGGCNRAATATWKTILVGGLGRGGRGYYALDITDPANPKALWEFTNDELGYSFGNPLITKVCNDATCATKTWAVIVTSGYNNIPNADGATGGGVGRLFVLNAATGAVIRTLSTGVGDVANPSGLARISGYVTNSQADNSVEAVFGGDLNGNLWRFDVNRTITAAGEAQLLAILKDAGNRRQPITTMPELGEIPSNRVKVVYVGTGRFLAGEDASDTSQQSIYAIKDARTAGAAAATAIFDNPGGDRSGVLSAKGFVRQVHSTGPCPADSPAYICVAGQEVLLTTANPVDFTLNNGWFVDLINPAERANTDPALVPGLLVFNTNAPSLLACDVGGKGYQYWFDYKSGTSLNGLNIIGLKLGDSLYSAPTIISTGGGPLKVLSGCSGPECWDVREPGDPPEFRAPRRTAWREWIRE